VKFAFTETGIYEIKSYLEESGVGLLESHVFVLVVLGEEVSEGQERQLRSGDLQRLLAYGRLQ